VITDRGNFELGSDPDQDLLKVGQNVLILKPQDSEAVGLKKDTSVRVFVRLQVVDWTVYLDYKPRPATVEINDIGTDSMLTSKRESLRAEYAQRLPQERLRCGR
jgi:hypothetical protein